MAKLRIYADLNSCWQDQRGLWCWCLRHDGRPLDDLTDQLGLVEGMAVTIYYADPADEFEYDAVLGKPGDSPFQCWHALIDDATFRRLR